MLFCNLLEVNVQYTLGCYYTLKVVIMVWNFVVLYGSCGTYSIQVVWNIICPKQFVWNIICPNLIIWKFYYCCYRLCQSRFFQYRVYGSCYCEMVVMVWAGNCMEHYLSKSNYMEVYLLLLQIVSKYIFSIQSVWKLSLWNGCYGMRRSLIFDQYFFHWLVVMVCTKQYSIID